LYFRFIGGNIIVRMQHCLHVCRL